jgi:hypothetical protein
MECYKNLNLNIGSSILVNPKILFDMKVFHLKLKKEDLHPKFLKICELKNLDVFSAEIFRNNSSYDNCIHVDAIPGLQLDDLPKINFVFGNKECPMVWYKELVPKKRNDIKPTAVGSGYYEFPIDSVQEIDRTYIRSCCIVQAGVPHTVINNSLRDRYCISIVVTKENNYFSFDQLVDEFKEYIVNET